MKNDYKISGAGQISGGEYNEVRIAGSAKIQADLSAELLKIAGSGKAFGNLKATTIEIAGAFTCFKSIEAQNIGVAGAISIKENLLAESADIRGSLCVDGEINVDKFVLYSNNSTINVLHGDSILIKPQNHLFIKKKKNVIKEIEATTIDISCVKTDYISGNKIVIGPKCIIKTVEYKDTIEIDKQAKVDQIIKIT